MAAMTDSILNSVKKLLGLDPEIGDFDADILMHINSSIFSLSQMGVGPSEGYTVLSSDDTFDDYLGEDFPSSQANMIMMYLYYKTRLSFDPPTISTVLQTLKECLAETEWRLHNQSNYSASYE